MRGGSPLVLAQTMRQKHEGRASLYEGYFPFVWELCHGQTKDNKSNMSYTGPEIKAWESCLKVLVPWGCLNYVGGWNGDGCCVMVFVGDNIFGKCEDGSSEGA